MADKRFKDLNWSLPTTDRGAIKTWEAVQIAVLMDVRDELKKLNTLLHCHNFTQMPHVMRRIDKRLAKRIKL